jgi:hypothetical protein
MEAHGESIHVQPLDLPLLVEDGALGYSEIFEVGDRAIQLQLPELVDDVVSGPGASSRLDLSTLLGDESWGTAYSQGDIDQAEIHAVAFTSFFELEVPSDLSPSSSVDAPQLRDIARNTDQWFWLWLSWCGALSSQPVRLFNPGTMTPSARTGNASRWLFVNDAEFYRQSIGGTVHVVGLLDREMHSERALNRETLTYAAARASAGETVPIDLELRADAHIASRRSGARHAIVEIGTAAEASLSRALGLAPAHGRTLGGLVADAIHAGIAIPADSKSHLVGPRNDAVHWGITPDRKMVSRALEIAEEIWQLADRDSYDLVARMVRTTRPMRQDLVIFTD